MRPVFGFLIVRPIIYHIVFKIRTIEREAKRPIGILVDLQGPKLRLGTFVGDAAVLENGQTFVLDSDPTPGDTDRVFLPHPEILSALEPSHGILIDDGTPVEFGAPLMVVE